MRKVLLLLIIVCFSGCTTVRTYPGDPLQKEKISMLKGAWNIYILSNVRGEIHKVDGKKIVNADVIELVPGEHEISVYLTKRLSYGLVLYGKLKTFRIITEAGHTYIVDGVWNDGNNKMWIQDEKTGKIIAGKKSSQSVLDILF